MDEVPADVSTFLDADVVNYAWKLHVQLTEEGILGGSGGMKVRNLNV